MAAGAPASLASPSPLIDADAKATPLREFLL